MSHSQIVALNTCSPTKGQLALEAINRNRAEAGLWPLEVDLNLISAARKHSADMVRQRFFSHTGSDGSEPGGRVNRAGFDWAHVGENIFAGVADPEFAVQSWMESPGHREVMLTGAFTHVGIGYLENRGTEFRYYWTANFGTPVLTPSEPEDGCHP